MEIDIKLEANTLDAFDFQVLPNEAVVIPLFESEYDGGRKGEGSLKISSIIENRAGLVPIHATEGGILFRETSNEKDQRRCLDLILSFEGDKGTEDYQLPDELPFLRAINNFAIQSKHIHIVMRFIYDGDINLPNRGLLRHVLTRVYSDHDFECTEHPEVLSGSPLGMYHCQVCGEMQMAGMMHIKDDEDHGN